MGMEQGKIKIILVLQIFLGLSLGYLPSEVKSQGNKQSLEKVILGISGSRAIINLPFDMGKKEGLYRNEGIDLDIMIMKGNITTAALNSGYVDYGGAPGNLIRASALGMPFKAIFLIADKLPQYVVTKPDIKNPKAMKGRSLGVGSLGGDNSLMAMEIIRFFGLDPERDVTVVGTGPDLKLQALMAGSVDAALVNSKEALMAKGKGFNILAKAADIIQMPGYGLGTTDKKIRDARNSVKRMVRASMKGFLLVKEKKQEALNFMTKEWGVDRKEGGFHYDMDIEAFTKDGSLTDAVIKTTLDMGRKIGMIKGEVPFSKVVDLSILREVHKELGIAP